MKQAGPGRKIAEARAKKGLTQQELSDRAGIDIRTLQRIEAGEVVPRPSTLQLITEVLGCDSSEFLPGPADSPVLPKNLLLVTGIAGLLYLVAWWLYGSPLPRPDFAIRYHFLIGILYMLTSVLFYYSFMLLGSHYKNRLLRAGALVVMVLVPLFFLSTLVDQGRYDFMKYVMILIVMLFGINGIVFGTALIRTRSPYRNLYLFTGILQLLQAPFYLLPFSLTWLIGNWIGVPMVVLLVGVVWREYRGDGRRETGDARRETRDA